MYELAFSDDVVQHAQVIATECVAQRNIAGLLRLLRTGVVFGGGTL